MAGAGLLAAVHRQPGDLQSVHPGWRAARRSGVSVAGQSAVSDRKSSCRPRIFRGQWFWSAGIPTVCFPGVRRTAKPVTAGISGVTARSSCRGWCSTWRRRVRRWYRRFPCCWRWYRSTTPPGEHLAQSLRDWRRSIVQCRTWLNGLPPVWSVFWVTPPGGQAAESRWFTITPERAGLQVQLKGQAPQAVAGWQREGSSASRLHQTLWLENILTLAENALFRPFRAPAGRTSSAEPVCRGHLPYAGGGGGE
ncbi:outer membrane protein [Klebsiella pneumoniae]|uniref:Outer membrane protein n=1 Tax=Klebsiella pneumoniae TaxID=573 RepID=A0A3S4KMF7_KLEPN|nr:outer membrane protein [Klebsiella pneumoniae]